MIKPAPAGDRSGPAGATPRLETRSLLTACAFTRSASQIRPCSTPSRRSPRVALIQSFNRRRIISPTGFTLLHSADTYRKVDGVGLTLDNRLAAMLVGTRVKFLSFHALRQVFDLSAYFAEATG